MQTMQQVTHAAKSLAGLLAGWVLGYALMWGALFLGALLGQATSDVADRALLGGMLLTICLLAVLLVAAGLAELRRTPVWLLTLLLGMATAPVLTLFGLFFFTWEDVLVD